ncbi:uncharacterized protein BJ171DRAFT_576635 [Polychytrium aggregatum]|uniref:uncharacterized protein n=1 Tax=Polychytrium aggregatum TaxID=110093 RepID=UPI0022FE8C43|nr:uncharacterized protein BJ171DRAFT_576635 [Polychytrium aggregatum]KAI9209848.1 hypothetical protein BJ171DRAFT_576635 [Polychytrium aggregatum]
MDFSQVYLDTFELEDMDPESLARLGLPSTFNLLTDPFPFESSEAPAEGSHELAPFLPSTKLTILEACRLAELGPDDAILDIGCGDGRICAAAIQKHRVRLAVGLDYDQELITYAESCARQCGIAVLPELESKPSSTQAVRFECRDLDSPAAIAYLQQLVRDHGITAVFLFLCSEMEAKPHWRLFLRQFCLEEMGCRIVAMVIDKNDSLGTQPVRTGNGIWVYEQRR